MTSNKAPDDENVADLNDLREDLLSLSLHSYNSFIAYDRSFSILLSQRNVVPSLFWPMPIERDMWQTMRNPGSAICYRPFQLVILCPVTYKIDPRGSRGNICFILIYFMNRFLHQHTNEPLLSILRYRMGGART